MKRALLSIMFMLSVVGLARAETMGFAQAIGLLQTSCGQDIERYCPTANLANFGISKCLEQNTAKLSPQCNQDRVVVRQQIQARLEAQASVAKVCNGDMRQLCPSIVRERGYTLNCLLKAEPSVSKACNQAITDAGWR